MTAGAMGRVQGGTDFCDGVVDLAEVLVCEGVEVHAFELCAKGRVELHDFDGGVGGVRHRVCLRVYLLRNLNKPTS